MVFYLKFMQKTKPNLAKSIKAKVIAFSVSNRPQDLLLYILLRNPQKLQETNRPVSERLTLRLLCLCCWVAV